MTVDLTLYGISNCDTVKKAKRWLDQQQINYQFHDLKTNPIHSEQLSQWAQQVGWENLLKKTGTTWRNIPEAERSHLDENKALHLMQQHYNLIKRPLLAANQQIILMGFKESEWQAWLEGAM